MIAVIIFCLGIHASHGTVLDSEKIGQADEKVFSLFPHLKNHSVIANKCVECHLSQTNLLEQSIHGQSGLLQKFPRGTLCLTCHEINHYGKDPRWIKNYHLQEIKKLTHDITCMRCHSDPLIGGIFGFPPHVPSEFEQSMHYRKSLLGDRSAPLCANCHGSHFILNVHDPRSSVHDSHQAAKVCAQCHSGANEAFAKTFNHKPITPTGKPMEYFVTLFFKLLTLGAFMALGFFMLLDVMAILRQKIFKSFQHPKVQQSVGKTHNEFVVRLNGALRLQHFLMLSSVIVLMLTSWPLMAPDSPAAQVFMHLIGGARSAAWIHRVAGFVMIADFIFHLIYLYLCYRRGGREFPLLPSQKDFWDVWGMVLYFLGLRKDKPRFAQFAFFEKFDYWAVFWGVAMMGGSGLILLFPIWVTCVFPSWVVSLAAIIHTDEALLAGVVLMIWHFYNVHFKPRIFPMNWAWLTGRMTRQQYEEEHPLHVEKLKKEGKWD